MTPQEEEKLKELVGNATKRDVPNWLSLVEKIILPVLLAITTVMLGVNSCNKDNVELKIAKRAQERDSINTMREYQLNLVKLYSENISSADSTKIKNAQNLIYLMDSAFAVRILSRPWYSYIEENGDPVYGKEGQNSVSVQKDILLRYSNITIYYEDRVVNKAKSIDSLLRINGAASNVLPKSYSLSEDNQIVYYDVSQLNYCKAVQDLLKKNNYGEFKIRPSSGKSSANFFKIYVVQ